MFLHLEEAADQSRLVLNLLHGPLGADDDVPDALAADTAVFSDLGEAEVLIVVEVKKFPLSLGQKLPVKIEQHSHAVGLVFHGAPSFV